MIVSKFINVSIKICSLVLKSSPLFKPISFRLTIFTPTSMASSSQSVVKTSSMTMDGSSPDDKVNASMSDVIETMDSGDTSKNGESLKAELKPGDMYKGKGPLSNRAYKRLKRQGHLDPAIKAKKQKTYKDDKDLESVPQDLGAETSYYFENGLRKVHPYYFTFSSYAKKRWQGRRLVDIFADEFRQESLSNYEKMFELGRVKVNGKATTRDYIIKNGDFLQNTLHRHETPVSAEPIEIVAETDKIVAINKPSSIPCHPCGRYRHNSIPFVLSREQGRRNLRGIYRLDRMTSGILIFCKDTAQTTLMQTQIKDRQVTKHYLAKVTGIFPSGVVEIKEPLETLTFKLGLHFVSPLGKEAHTSFECLSTDLATSTSIVKCTPHTGRTHQIRVHLQYLGFPIVNDDLYNHEAWGPERGKGGNYGKSKEQLVEDLFKHHDHKLHLRTTVNPPEQSPGSTDPPTTNKDDKTENLKLVEPSMKVLPENDQLEVKSEIDTKLNIARESEKIKGLEGVIEKEDSEDIDSQLLGSKTDSNCNGTHSTGINRTVTNSSTTTTSSMSANSATYSMSTSSTATTWSSTVTGSTATSSTGTGSTAKNSTATGSTDTSSTATGSTDTSSTSTGSTATGSTVTSSIATSLTDTSSPVTSSISTGSTDTSSTSTGSTGTSSISTGSTGTSSHKDPYCEMCSLDYSDPAPEELVMYLHAYEYCGPGWKYSTPLPSWAEEKVTANIGDKVECVVEEMDENV